MSPVAPVAPAGQAPFPYPPVAGVPEDIEYRPAGQAHPGIDNDTWGRMTVEQRLAYTAAPEERKARMRTELAANQRAIATAVGQGATEIIRGIFSAVSQEQTRAADAASEERLMRFRALVRQDELNRPTVHVEASTSDLPATSTGNVFTRQLGGVPVWGWGLIAIGVGSAGYYAYTKLGNGKKKSKKKK
jgi:hypothetical protein